MKVLAKGLNTKEVKLKDIATYPVVGVDKNGFLIDAMLLMAKHGIRRVVIFEGNTPLGVLEDKDIIAKVHLRAQRQIYKA